MRLRPILMTSLAFTCGIIPLVIATGPSSEIQNSIGTGVLGGMISGTVLAIFFVPVFFVFINELIEKCFRKAKTEQVKGNHIDVINADNKAVVIKD